MRPTRYLLVLATVALVAPTALLGACKAKPEIIRASCDVAATRSCEDYESQTKIFIEGRIDDCKQVKGTWSTSACPTAELAGACTEITKKWTRVRRYYAGFATPLERLKAECGAYGTWAP